MPVCLITTKLTVTCVPLYAQHPLQSPLKVVSWHPDNASVLTPLFLGEGSCYSLYDKRQVVGKASEVVEQQMFLMKQIYISK